MVGSPRLDLPAQAACELRVGGGPRGQPVGEAPARRRTGIWLGAGSLPCLLGHGGPLRVLTLPALPPTVSTKDLIETCCAAGQQWAIDNDECLDIPESGAEGDVCR